MSFTFKFDCGASGRALGTYDDYTDEMNINLEGIMLNGCLDFEAKGELKPQETRIGLDGREISVTDIGTSKNLEVNPFDEWFTSHVFCGDMFDVLANDSLKYDLIIVDPPYGITDEKWDKQTKFDLLTFTRRCSH